MLFRSHRRAPQCFAKRHPAAPPLAPKSAHSLPLLAFLTLGFPNCSACALFVRPGPRQMAADHAFKASFCLGYCPGNRGSHATNPGGKLRRYWLPRGEPNHRPGDRPVWQDAWRSKPTAGSYGAAGGSASVGSPTKWRYKATARLIKDLSCPSARKLFGSSLVIE